MLLYYIVKLIKIQDQNSPEIVYNKILHNGIVEIKILNMTVTFIFLKMFNFILKIIFREL